MSDTDEKAKYGRVRKKSAKFLEMEEFEEAEKKHYVKKGSTDASKSKSATVVVSPSGPTPAKKPKIKVEDDDIKEEEMDDSPVHEPPITPPTPTKVSPSPGLKGSQAPSSVIKLLLSSPAVPTTPSVSTKAVTKTSPNSDGSEVPEVSSLPNVKKSLKVKIKLEADEEFGESPAVKTSDSVIDADVKPLINARSFVSTSTKSIDAAGSKESLKMKLFLSPKDKKPKISFEEMLESGNDAAALVTKVIKKKPKKPKVVSNVPKDVSEEKPVLLVADEPILPEASIITTGKKSIKKKLKSPSTPKLNTLSADFVNKLGASPIDVEFEPNLVIAEDGVKLKKKTLGIGKSKKKQLHINTSKMAAPEGDIAALAAKVKSGDKKGKKKNKDEGVHTIQKRKRPPTAYTLYCNGHRAKLVAENPGIDFAQISRRLGEMWQTLTKKEKWSWRRKAKKLAGKGSTLISTGKVLKQTKVAVVKEVAPEVQHAPPSLPVAKPMVPHFGARISKAVVEDSPLSPVKGFGTDAVDVAAHLKLLGESLGIIGNKLQEHKGLIAVQGSMSVLLDSLLCSFGPLVCLTQQISELNGCSQYMHAKTLDNIAYVMPGL